MPSRIIPFVNGQVYHIFNRGTEKRPIFESRRDRQKFLKTINYYQFAGPKPKFSHFSLAKSVKLDLSQKIVEVLAYCLMPNHFHFLVRQLREGGITEFVSKLSNSYTKFYNIKYNRVGPLFQGEFKSVFIESDEQMIHVSRYIHLNPLVAFLVKDLKDYEWSSYKEYLNQLSGFCNKDFIMDFFKSPEEYQQFTQDRADFLQSIEVIYPQLIDDDLA